MNRESIRTAIRTWLLDDSALVALLGSSGAVYFDRAPKNHAFPCVLFGKQTGVEVNSFADAYKDQQWLIQGVCVGADPAKAEAIDAKLAELLEDAELDIEGGETLACYRLSDVEYGDLVDGTQHYYVGALYRVVVQP